MPESPSLTNLLTNLIYELFHGLVIFSLLMVVLCMVVAVVACVGTAITWMGGYLVPKVILIVVDDWKTRRMPLARLHEALKMPSAPGAQQLVSEEPLSSVFTDKKTTASLPVRR